ncbi:bifunctional 4-hydroxy-2-oxoglutarate aldolase/2-dehydro-3-deoxy-phosphogluconate aldolase [Parafrigoribacterium humi]|uniref:bifunctional 4-hydroxy-2-oxoglutarate aldolase/2-dehydro-3-deoxy-phosphogluconate aldolase n=1 Tax=Parafrigoribacterium humi TaxID=3144664 RepID=UPI0032EF7BED
MIAIIRLKQIRPQDELFRALVAGGITTVEVTLPTPGSTEAVERWRDEPGVLVGMGTIRTRDDVHRAVGAGARFLVTPTTSADVLAAANEESVPVVCGALTPTEIDLAWRSGASRVKVFPVDAVGGLQYLRALAGPLEDIPLVPTGGITPVEAEEYAAFGCVGVGVGSALVNEQVAIDREWEALHQRARHFVSRWSSGIAR